jgi:hypothetical protein
MSRLGTLAVAVGLLGTVASGTALGGATSKPTVSAEISGNVGRYRPAIDDFEVHLRWRLNGPDCETYAWSVWLITPEGRRFVTANGLSYVPTGSEMKLVQARSRAFQVIPYIEGRCFKEPYSSDIDAAYGDPITIPARPPDGDGDGDGPGTGGDGGSDGQGPGTGDGGGQGGRGPGPGPGSADELPPRCAHVILGTSRDDRLAGTGRADGILAFGGDDVATGLAGADCLAGHGGADLIRGGPDDDDLFGGGGRDRLRGGAGKDLLAGGRRSDRLDGGAGVNRLYGGSGNDRVDAANGRRDLVDCGAGDRDVARVDQDDRHRGCELRLRP